MRGNGDYGLLKIVVVLEFCLVVLLPLDHGGADFPLSEHQAAQHLAHVSTLRNPLRNDVSRPLQGFFHMRYAFFRVHEARSEFWNTLVARLLFPEKARQGFQATLERYARFGLTLRTIGQIQVFEFDLVKASHDLRTQFVTELSLFCQRR